LRFLVSNTDHCLPIVKKDPPYRIAEEGWGEFEMYVTFTPAGKGAEVSVTHDLNFQDEIYDNVQELVSLVLLDIVRSYSLKIH
jgi:transcription initiation factor IIF auxiliary subunit